MFIKFWGVRGSIPTPGRATVKYGGNTPCIEIRPYDDERLFILDCGTGLREFGNELMRTDQRRGPVKANIFVSHTHWDHLHGFPFFVPAFIPKNEFHIHGPVDFDEKLENLFIGQMKYQYFPVKLTDMAASIRFTEVKESQFTVEGVSIHAKYLHHPILVLGYRFTVNGKVFVYATDIEPYYNVFRGKDGIADDDPMVVEAEKVIQEENQRVSDWFAGADLLVHDAQYTAAEYPAKVSWGHSSMEWAVEAALRGDVKRLALFHHDPTRDDAALDRELERIRLHAKTVAPDAPLEVFAAYEGLEFRL